MKLCLWADLKPEHIAALDAAVDEAGTQQVLAQALQLVPEDNPLRHSVLLEFYVNNVRFARENGFTIEKLSAFFSIMKRNHNEMVEAFLPMEKSWEHFKALLLAHAVQRPPHWGGFCLVPDEIEFWADGEHRLHDRFRFTRGSDCWDILRLNP